MKNVKIIRIPVATPTLWPNTETNCYLIGSEHESLLIDAGYDTEETKDKIEQAVEKHEVQPPESILLTHSHPDHAPGVRQLRDLSPTVYCHQAEYDPIADSISPVKDIKTLNDGDILTINQTKMEVIHGPGHTAGQLNLYIPSEKMLLAGDNVVSEGTTWIGPPDGDMSDYLNTLHRLKKLDIDKIGPGHGEWVVNPKEKLEFIIARRLKREQQIKDLLNEYEQLSASELTQYIYKDQIHPSVFDVAKRTIEAHLNKLIKEGQVKQQNNSYTTSI
ncbi:hypothetical protein GCM10008986_24480 [Salinibacillus aidingensis]|uniref:Metallo-beta-lactamase domain-containing protein n=1 Tax=Salinibacillus aidingensis TaxID=237684 RepID=A0ABN1BF77_9BACI